MPNSVEISGQRIEYRPLSALQPHLLNASIYGDGCDEELDVFRSELGDRVYEIHEKIILREKENKARKEDSDEQK